VAMGGGALAAMNFIPGLMPPTTNGYIGRLTQGEVQQLKAAVDQARQRLNGVNPSVIVGIPQHVIVGGWDDEMPGGRWS